VPSIRPLLCLYVALFLAGCSSATSPGRESARTGPHGGPALPLPGDQGFGEVVLETDPAAKPGSPPRVVIYFLRADLKTALDATPTSVIVKLKQPSGEPIELTLASTPKPIEPAGAGRFASPPVKDPTDPLIGDVLVTLGGQTTTIPFSSR
jgi:hypothetical protein